MLKTIREAHVLMKLLKYLLLLHTEEELNMQK